ncbi:hypothetical protein GUITHDRAFT_115324 [Guillardia theta CCMP2712]|uniref:Uncharacterized protein n=1 Tax=Guillardia theta (strain CCMP2712) TaxID=905079 RepID=L1IRM0_GUITC|nr:hypothetical protein GUITHDRAFT_115324 [Guillardia theta CCMP2712]EKX38549.1 hypothetical protein GUITHDRAFT_115324 [Guillardia theta CCMP2712]|eukprot:XP_005825529.1 hypothetical protein GUITHDRAFT_115324 [Guillardia theta CCMP2712]
MLKSPSLLLLASLTLMVSATNAYRIARLGKRPALSPSSCPSRRRPSPPLLSPRISCPYEPRRVRKLHIHDPSTKNKLKGFAILAHRLEEKHGEEIKQEVANFLVEQMLVNLDSPVSATLTKLSHSLHSAAATTMPYLKHASHVVQQAQQAVSWGAAGSHAMQAKHAMLEGLALCMLSNCT